MDYDFSFRKVNTLLCRSVLRATYQKGMVYLNDEKLLLVILIIVFIIALILTIVITLSKEKLREHLADIISSLDKDDFDIINETKIGALDIYPEKSQNKGGGIEFVNRELELDGNIKVGIAVPLNSVHLFNDDCVAAHDLNEIIGVNTHLRVSEQQYSKYLDLVKGCDVTSTISFYLDIKLSNANVIALIGKWNKRYATSDIITQYMFERYNVLNLITDMQPFSDDEISDLINKIKDRMIERLHM